MNYNKYIILLAAVLSPIILSAQEERRFIREGYNAFMKGNFADAEVAFQRARNADSTSFIAAYNLGNAFYMQEKYDQAEHTFSQLAQTNTEHHARADLYYNFGNTQTNQAISKLMTQDTENGMERLRKALESYKQSLLLNPSDLEAKYNYALVKELLKQMEDQQQDQNEGESEQDKDDENQEQNNEQDNEQDKDDNDADEEQKEQEIDISEQNAEMLLQIIENKDQEIQEELKKDKNKHQKKDKEKNW